LILLRHYIFAIIAIDISLLLVSWLFSHTAIIITPSLLILLAIVVSFRTLLFSCPRVIAIIDFITFAYMLSLRHLMLLRFIISAIDFFDYFTLPHAFHYCITLSCHYFHYYYYIAAITIRHYAIVCWFSAHAIFSFDYDFAAIFIITPLLSHTLHWYWLAADIIHIAMLVIFSLPYDTGHYWPLITLAHYATLRPLISSHYITLVDISDFFYYFHYFGWYYFFNIALRHYCHYFHAITHIVCHCPLLLLRIDYIGFRHYIQNSHWLFLLHYFIIIATLIIIDTAFDAIVILPLIAITLSHSFTLPLLILVIFAFISLLYYYVFFLFFITDFLRWYITLLLITITFFSFTTHFRHTYEAIAGCHMFLSPAMIIAIAISILMLFIFISFFDVFTLLLALMTFSCLHIIDYDCYDISLSLADYYFVITLLLSQLLIIIGYCYYFHFHFRLY